MIKTFLKISLSLAAVACLTWNASAAVSEPVKQLTGHVPSVVAKLNALGRVPSTNTIHLAIGLSLHNQAGLDALLQQVYDPSSPNYHHYLSTADFTAQFGPSEDDYQAVIAFAKANGLTVKATPANRMLVEVDGPVSNVEHAFSVTLNNYKHPTENRNFYAPTTEPFIPASLPILEIGGLNNYSSPHSHLKPKTFASSSPIPGSGSGAGGTYVGNDFRKAYVPGTTLTGAGQKIALVQFDGYTSNDITAYETLAGRSAISLTNILLNGFSGLPTGNGGEVEVSLDIEMVISMAPGINQIMVYEGNPDPNFFQPNPLLNRIAVDNVARQISSSWAWGGGPSRISDQIFQEMALQGQTYLTAAGDSDAYLPGEVDSPNQSFCPASSPYITAVGGTTLTTTNGGAFFSETVWNWGLINSNYDGVGGCGGISTYYAIPAWQEGISMTNNGGSLTNRNIPDVAFTADNVLVIADGSSLDEGGTSCAAPLWGAFTALINQEAASNNLSSVGFLNPKIYALAKTTNYATYFNDVTNGNNTWSQSPSSFYAKPGYDLCTGLGTPNGTNFINALASTNGAVSGGGGGTGTVAPIVISAPTPPWGSTLSVMNGSNPNGVWFLFVQDDQQLNVGMIDNGWSVAITSGNSIGVPADKEVYAPTNAFLALEATTNIVIAVTNYGPAIATNVIVTDTLPDTGMYLNYYLPNGTNITVAGNTLTWYLGNLTNGAGSAVTLNFTGVTAGTYTNSPSIYSSTTDPNTADKFADTVFTVGTPSMPQLVASSTSSGQVVLSVTNTAISSSVIVQATTNLLAGQWLNIYTNTTPFTLTINARTNYPARFYRAVIGQ